MNKNRIGIDQLNFYTPSLYVDLVDLAHARNVDPSKYTIGIGQEKMAINPATQDIITMAANAALPIVSKEDAKLIDMVILATESGIDYSKAGAVSIHKLLNINSFARCIEIKQACYSATAGIMMAKDYVSLHPDRKVLVVGSDISRYGFNTSGEVTQGAGAVAMLISSNPRILVLEDNTVMYTEDVYDFWRPSYMDNAIVDGKYSNEVYNRFFETVLNGYQDKYGLDLENVEALCFHLPYSKMGKKAIGSLNDRLSNQTKERLLSRYEDSIVYTKDIGNIYTGSLYLGLISLLDNSSNLNPEDRIGFFSYGSGAVAEFFCGTLVGGFEKHLFIKEHKELLKNRKCLSIAEYEELFQMTFPTDGSYMRVVSNFDDAPIQIIEIDNHQRRYGFVK